MSCGATLSRRLCGTIMLVPVVATLFFSTRMALSGPPISIPTGTPWDMTTYCNAPHVLASHYKEPNAETELVHVTVFMRHHKAMTLYMCLLSIFQVETPSACSSYLGS